MVRQEIHHRRSHPVIVEILESGLKWRTEITLHDDVSLAWLKIILLI